MPHKSPLLIIDEDGDIRAALADLLSFEGFDVETCDSTDKAISFVPDKPHSLVIADVVTNGSADLGALERLADAVRPAPVVVTTAWGLTPEQARAHGAVNLLPKPFDVERLLSLVAQHGPSRELAPAQETAIRAYFAALTNSDWAGLGKLLTPDVGYHLPAGGGDFNNRLDGRDAVVKFAKAVFPQFPECRFTVNELWALPCGAVAHYTSQWKGPDGQPAKTTGYVLFRFEGALIQTIGVRLALEKFLSRRVQTPRTDFARA